MLLRDLWDRFWVWAAARRDAMVTAALGAPEPARTAHHGLEAALDDALRERILRNQRDDAARREHR